MEEFSDSEELFGCAHIPNSQSRRYDWLERSPSPNEETNSPAPMLMNRRGVSDFFRFAMSMNNRHTATIIDEATLPLSADQQALMDIFNRERHQHQEVEVLITGNSRSGKSRLALQMNRYHMIRSNMAVYEARIGRPINVML